MKRTMAIITCLAALGPAVALAHHGQSTRVVVKEHYSHPHETTVVKTVVTVKQPRGNRYGEGRSQHHSVVYGRVLSVEPIYRYVDSGRQHGSCVRYVDEHRPRGSYTSTLLGAIIGGAVGHRLGDRHGDPGVAAVAGGVLGASIGRDLGNQLEHRRRVVVDGPCGYQDDRARREVVEYAVRYRYNGEEFYTRMDYDPGEWIALDVKPV